MLLEDVVDAAELGLTVDNLQDAGCIQSLKESLMASPNQLSTERVGALMAALKRWKRFALPRKYPLRSPTPLQVAEFLREVSRGGPTAAASIWQALKWFKEKMGMPVPCDHFLVLPYKNFPTAYSSSQAVELQPWELVNLVLFARQQRGTNLVLICFLLQCSVSCIRFEHFQRSRFVTNQAEWARFWCRQGKRRVRGARPGYEWATPELAWQGFSLLKVLSEFFKHECLSDVGFLWPQVQLDPQDLWEIHDLLPRGSWTWPELAAANDRLGPLEIAPIPAPEGAIEVDNPEELSSMEPPHDQSNPEQQDLPVEPEPIHSDGSSSTTSTSASDVSAAGSDMEGVIPLDAVMEQAKWIQQGSKTHVVKSLDADSRPVPWCRDFAFQQDPKRDGQGFGTTARQLFCQRCLARMPRAVYSAVAAQCGWLI